MLDDRDLFFSSDNPKTLKIIKKARSTNASRDASELKGKHAPPSLCPLDLELRTVITALVSGLEAGDWDCVAEGIAMLQDAEMKLRGCCNRPSCERRGDNWFPDPRGGGILAYCAEHARLYLDILDRGAPLISEGGQE